MVQVFVETLETTGIKDIHAAFLSAFSDYKVKFDMPLWRFEQMLRRRGFSPHHSVGAFANSELVGFVLNSPRMWGGVLTANDSGTGVVPTWRRQGLTTRMMNATRRVLRDHRVRRYLLEVIKDNTPAVDLYMKQGFKQTRGFICYAAQRGDLRMDGETKAELRTERVSDIDWRRAPSFWDFNPSWQNSVESVVAVPQDMAIVTAYKGNAMVGYGVIERRTGDVPQLAVHKEYRLEGTGQAIMAELVRWSEVDRIALINIEEGRKEAHDAILAMGFSVLTEQYEMVLDL